MKVLITAMVLSFSAMAQNIEIKDPNKVFEVFKTSGESIQNFQIDQKIEIDQIEYLKLENGTVIYQEELTPEHQPEINQESLNNLLREQLINDLGQSDRFLIIRSGTNGGGS
jgi:hypothetical protein